MYNSLPNVISSSNRDIKTFENHLDKKRFFKFESSHYDFIMENKHIVSPNDPHPSAEGHSQWAKQLKDFIDANNLRTL